MTPPNSEQLLALAEHWERGCNRYVNGQCHSRRCLMRGGYSGTGPVKYCDATCEEHETAIVLRAKAANQ